MESAAFARGGDNGGTGGEREKESETACTEQSERSSRIEGLKVAVVGCFRRSSAAAKIVCWRVLRPSRTRSLLSLSLSLAQKSQVQG